MRDTFSVLTEQDFSRNPYALPMEEQRKKPSPALQIFANLNIACYPYFVHAEASDENPDEPHEMDDVLNHLDTIRIHLKLQDAAKR